MIGELPLFPLQAVLFPGGLLSLKGFEARYLDLVGRCLREKASFGVVCLRQGTEVQRTGAQAVTRFEHFGVLAQHDHFAESGEPGTLEIAGADGGTRRVRPIVDFQDIVV